MNRTDQILEMAKEKGIVSAKDVTKAGISRSYLPRLCKEGLLVRSMPGLYMLPDAPLTEHINLIQIAKKIPEAVVCLISALSFYEITTQLPSEIWIAIPRNSSRPQIKYPPLNLTFLSKVPYSFGIEEHNINGVTVKVYSLAKTVADCFKFRSKVGLDVAIEAMKEALSARKVTVDELVQAARINRVFQVMRPYLEAIYG